MGRAACAALACVATLASAGPIEVYREGPRYCPRDRDPHGAAITEAQAIDRAAALLPGDFCGPTRFVSGCDVLHARAHGSCSRFVSPLRAGEGDGREAGAGKGSTACGCQATRPA